MAAIVLLAVCLVAVSSACDICGDPNHNMMNNWGQQQQQQGQQQMQQQQMQQQMMMNMLEMMMQQKNWGNENNNNGGGSGNSNGASDCKDNGGGNSNNNGGGNSNNNGGGNSNNNGGGSSNTNGGQTNGGTVIATGCQGFSDVVLLMDSSGSIGEENFKLQLDFISHLVESFQLARNGRDGYQFSVVSFAKDARQEFSLSQYNTARAMQNAIKSIQYMSRNTDTHSGLKFVRQNSFLSSNGGRYGAVKIVIVITDGRSNQPTETSKEANELRKFGALVLAIGVGNDVDPKELEDIASTKKNVFRVDNFDVLDTLRQEVEKRACEITIEQGGGSNGTRTAFDWQTYLRWCTEQQMMKGEQKINEDILKSFEDYKVQEKKEDENKMKEKEEKNHMEFMKSEVMRLEKHLAETEYIGDYLMEVKHKFMYMVTSEVIKFCPMEGMQSDIIRLMIHGDDKWRPGRADQCNMDDMEKIDNKNGTVTAVEVAAQIANLSQEKQMEMYFSGLKDSICDSLKDYMNLVKNWEDQFPQLKRMLGIMF